MSQRIRTKVKKRRGFTYLWILALALLVFLLIYFEQTALLYIVSTLGVTILLIIVAATDLGKSDLSALEAEPGSAQVSAGKSKK